MKKLDSACAAKCVTPSKKWGRSTLWVFRFFKKSYEYMEKADSFKSIAEFISEWILPFTLPIAAAIAGYLQREPIMWIITASTLCFMSVVLSWLAIMFIRDKTTPLNKLSYQVVYAQTLDTPEAPQISSTWQIKRAVTGRLLGANEVIPEVSRRLEITQLGIEITNNSSFPISCVLESVLTKVNGETPPRSVFPKPPADVGPFSKVRILDDPIKMHGAPCKNLSCYIDMIVKYGKPGKERFKLAVKGVIEVTLTDYGHPTQVALNVNDTVVRPVVLPGSVQ